MTRELCLPSRVCHARRDPLLSSAFSSLQAGAAAPLENPSGGHGRSSGFHVACVLGDADLLAAVQAFCVARQGPPILRGIGPSPSIRFPEGGPYDQRLGYSRLPQVLQRLSADGQFQIESQARPSAMMQRVTELGLFPVYREKAQAGLSILGCDGASLAVSRYPQHIYADFASVPPLIVHTLLFIENRELLDSRYPHRNPAVEWDRLGHAAIQRIAHLVLIGGNSPGGSTLATQIEKYRHSPGVRTNSVTEKFRQMASASLRAYMNGEDTLATRE